MEIDLNSSGEKTKKMRRRFSSQKSKAFRRVGVVDAWIERRRESRKSKIGRFSGMRSRRRCRIGGYFGHRDSLPCVCGFGAHENHMCVYKTIQKWGNVGRFIAEGGFTVAKE